MDGGHQAPADAEVIEDHLGKRSQAVGGAGGIGDDMVDGRVILILVDPHDKGLDSALGRCGDDDLAGTRHRDGPGPNRHRRKIPCTRQHIPTPVLPPGDVGGIAMAGNSDMPAIDDNPLFIGADILLIDPHYRIILQQVRQGGIVGEIVDRHHLDIRKGRIPAEGPEDVPADTAETVDSYFHCHIRLLLMFRKNVQAPGAFCSAMRIGLPSPISPWSLSSDAATWPFHRVSNRPS